VQGRHRGAIVLPGIPFDDVWVCNTAILALPERRYHALSAKPVSALGQPYGFDQLTHRSTNAASS
jgi:hypothetical protein